MPKKNENNTPRGVKCSFCGKSQESAKRIVAGPNVYICDECIDLCKNIVENEFYEDDQYVIEEDENLPNPAEIKEILDQYVIRTGKC